MRQDWNDIMPITGIEEDCIVSKSGDLTIALQVEKPEIFTISAATFIELHQLYIRALRILPHGSTAHLQDWYWLDEWLPAEVEPASWLGQCSDRHFYERPWVRHEAYIYLTRPGSKKQSFGQSTAETAKGHLTSRGLLDQADIGNFLSLCDQFKQILEQSNLLKVHRLGKAELWSTQEKAGLIERYSSLQPSSQPIIQDISIKPDLRIGDKFVKLYTLTDERALPESCSEAREYMPFSTPASRIHIGFASPLGLSLPFNHIYNQYFVIQSPREALKELDTRRLRMQALSKLSPANAVAAENIQQFISEASASQEPILRSHINLMTWHPDLDTLAQYQKKIAGALSEMEISPKLETISAPTLWWAGIPGNEASLPEHETILCLASRAACFIQQETNSNTSVSANGLRLNDRLTGRPLDIDLYYSTRKIISNWNTLILSASGGGKSFFTNHLVQSDYMAGSHILIIDIGHSYEIQCAYHKGTYISSSADRRIGFNPFTIGQHEIPEMEAREHIKVLLMSLWKKSDEPIHRSEYVAISNAITGYFDQLQTHPHIRPGFDSFYEFMQSDFQTTLQRQSVKDRDFDLANFLYIMRMFYAGGEYDYLLNATENIDLTEQRFVVFDLDSIRSNPVLFTATTISIMALFDAKIRKLRGIKKTIVIEEAWQAIALDSMADYIKYLYKTMRKHRGHPILVTQEIEDIMSSDIIRHTVIANSDIRILLDQSKLHQKFDTIQEVLGLSEQQKSEVLSLNRGHDPARRYKDVWIGLGATHSRVYSLEVSPEEYYMYTSDAVERIKVRDAIRKTGDVKKGIESLIIAEKPHA